LTHDTVDYAIMAKAGIEDATDYLQRLYPAFLSGQPNVFLVKLDVDTTCWCV